VSQYDPSHIFHDGLCLQVKHESLFLLIPARSQHIEVIEPTFDRAGRENRFGRQTYLIGTHPSSDTMSIFTNIQ
jgi:hypothetical protein